MELCNGFARTPAQVKQFHDPFAYILYNYQTENYCSYCLRCPLSSKDKLLLCSNCRLARYCNRDCQRQAWLRDHKPECARLKASFPNLPLTDVLFLARIVERLNFIKSHGDVHNWQRERNFDEMMTHEEETRQDPEKVVRFEKIFEKAKRFLGEAMPDREEFFLIFCRVWINSHSIHASVGTEIGMALDLGVSRYDHNCRPTATLVFDGFKASLRPLLPKLDTANVSKTFISYVDVGRSKYQRRRQLWSQWYFQCMCERCQDPEDDRLTSIRCSNSTCGEPILITEETAPIDVKCPRCGSIISGELVQNAQSLMNSVPMKLSTGNNSDEDLERCRLLLDKAKEILHPENIYLNRLITAYTEMTDGQDLERSSIENLVSVYKTYKRCYPANDKRIGYHLLHLIKAFIERGRRSEAVPYAHEAMSVFEVCFGIEHPYHLKTLALWTYLDIKAEKTDKELLELMNFNYNRPVDLATVIESAAP